MTSCRSFLLVLAAGLSLPGLSCSDQGDTITLQGCGGTFPAPLYKRWFLEYYKRHPEVRTNYQAIGSGAGIRQFSSGLVHFGASDESLDRKKLEGVARDLKLPMSGKELPVLQVPMTAGSVALCYNLPGVAELRLTRKAYVGIILSDIAYWDEEEIVRANPAVSLPHERITFIRRAEASGTTYVFTSHLSAIDERWRKPKGPGEGKTIQWPVGIGGKGNSGVAALIEQTPGALGYIETGYAELTHLPMATLENRSGEFVKPTEESSRLALAEAHFNDVLQATVHDPQAKKAYPIVTFTWIICRKKYDDPRVAEALKDVLRFSLTEGQQWSADLGYIPLPKELARDFLKTVDQISP